MLEHRFMTIEQMHEYIAQFLEVFRLQLEAVVTLEVRMSQACEHLQLTQEHLSDIVDRLPPRR